MICFGVYRKTSIFAPAIEKRWRDIQLDTGLDTIQAQPFMPVNAHQILVIKLAKIRKS